MENENKNVITRSRIIVILFIMFILFLIIIARVFYMQLFNTKASLANLKKLSTKEVYGISMPRGRIYDRNYNIIVDNIDTNLITYKKEAGTTIKDEIEYAYKLASKIDVAYTKLTQNILKDFWIANNEDKANKKITDKEYELYERRKLKATDLEKLKKERITKKELSSYGTLDKEAAYIYYLMNNGYYYDEKVIKEEASDEEYAYIAQNNDNLKGLSASKSWKRTYPYGDVFKTNFR